MRRAGFSILAACLIPLSVLSTTAHATVSELPRTDRPVQVDGKLDDAAWQDATRIDIDIETVPGENIPARVRTVAYLVEDGNSLYIAFDAEDPHPGEIRAFLRDRDAAYSDDFVGVVVDTYGDERRAFEFFVNPLGVQMDRTNDDINQRRDDSWNAIWDSVGRIHDAGYVVEMEIPLSQLRFPAVDGKQRWGIDLLRFYPREFSYRFSNNPQDRSVNCYLCQFQKIEGLEGARAGKNLEIVPTLTASQIETTDDPAAEPLSSPDAEAEAGMTVRWGVTPDMTLNLAVNPDFSQVEADVAQLDINNQFALFFPETRPFFLEGADYFNTPIRAVFTRTVADPSVGAKLIGKRGMNTYGVFAARDEVTNLLVPGTFGSDSEALDIANTQFVGRYARSFGESSSIGALVTTRSGDRYHNYVGGLDLTWRITEQHSVRAQHLRSDTLYPDEIAEDFGQPRDAFSGHASRVGYNYESRNWFSYASYRARDRTFRADAGFVPQVNFAQKAFGLGRIWYGEVDDWYTQLKLNGDWDISHDDEGRLLEKELEGYFTVEGPMQSTLRLGGVRRDKLFDDVLYREDQLSVFAELQPRGGLEFGMRARSGSQIDFDNSRPGDEFRLQPFATWNVNRNLLLRYRGNVVSLDTRDGSNIFRASVQDVRLTWQFNVRSFLRVTAQYSDVRRNLDEYIDPDEFDARSSNFGRQLLYSYKLNPQTVFFLGYSDALVEEDDLDRLTTTDRTVFMKFGYAWTP